MVAMTTPAAEGTRPPVPGFGPGSGIGSGPTTGTGTATGIAETELVTGEGVALDVRPTGFLLRCLGGAIDLAVSVGVLVGLEALVLAAGGVLDQAAQRALQLVAVVLSIVVLPIAVELALRGRSLGRLAVGARIVRDDGGAAGFRHAFIRALLGSVELYATFGGLAVLVALLNPRSKRLGDLLAGTYSQYERMPRYQASVVAMPALLEAWGRTADVTALPAPLARRIRSFLSQHQAMSWSSRSTLASSLAAEAAPYVSPVPPVDAELFLVGVAAARGARELAALEAEQRRLAALEPQLAALPHGFPER